MALSEAEFPKSVWMYLRVCMWLSLKLFSIRKQAHSLFLQPEPHFSNFETKVLAKALTVGCHDAKGDVHRISFICWYQLLKLQCSPLQTAPAPSSTWSCCSETLVTMKMSPKANQARPNFFFFLPPTNLTASKFPDESILLCRKSCWSLQCDSVFCGVGWTDFPFCRISSCKLIVEEGIL